MKIIDNMLHAVIARALRAPATRDLLVEQVATHETFDRAVAPIAEEKVDEAIDHFERNFRVEVEADEIRGLDREVEEAVDQALRDAEIDASRVDDLDEFIEAQVEKIMRDPERRAQYGLPALPAAEAAEGGAQ